MVCKELKTLWYTNVNGLMSTRLEVEELLSREKPDMLVLCETKWKDEWGIPDLGNGRYEFWIKNRQEKAGGGVMVLTNKEVRVVRVDVSDNRAEIVKVVVQKGNEGERIFVGVYVPPKTSAWTREEHEAMIGDTMKELEDLTSKGKDMVIVGDFNCKQVNWEEGTCHGEEYSYSDRLLSWAQENLMKQWIDCETRFRGGDAPARLDLLFTSDCEVVDDISYDCPLGKSDHVLVKVSLGEEMQEENEDCKLEKYRYNKANYAEMRKYFEAADWSKFEMEEEVQEKWREFLKIYSKAVDLYVPKGRSSCYKTGKEWYNDKCLKARKCKMRAWNRWRAVKTEERWMEFIEARNESVRINREEKYNYEKRIMDKCKSDPKLFYRHVNSKMKKREGISSLKVDGVMYDQEQDMSEVMNRCFQSVFTEEGEFEGEEVELGEGILDEVEVQEQDIMKLMEGLEVNKAPGPDGVSNWILKECRDQLVRRIHCLVSLSLSKGEVPRDWKRANIVPIFKGGSKDNPLNYRPVSLISVVGKICESVVKNAWMRYLEGNNVLNNGQYGFRRGSSCSANLLSYYSRVIEVVQERNGWVDGVYLDLKKAFDKVPHRRLLWKIAHHGGVGGRLLKWMEDYLRNREMRTTIRNGTSTWLAVTSGVPQGSVLGPVMFGIYVNDMVDGIDSYMNLFADDAKMMRRVESVNDCRNLQEDLDKISDWSKTWKMEFNLRKCKVLEFGRSERRVHWDYRMDEVSLEKSGVEVDLGVTITEGLTPDRHISRITGEVMNLLRRVKMAFTYLDSDMMRKFIVSLVRPRLEYAATVWSPHLKKDIMKLERVQRAATKMVPELRDLPYEDRLRIMNLPSLEDRRERGDLISVYKMMNGLDRVGEELLRMDDRNTRGHGKKLKKDSCVRDIKKYSFPHRVVNVWNGLPENIVNAKTIHKFKAELDTTRYRDRT